MVINVLDFYRRPEGKGVNPFLSTLFNPIFYILANVNGKTRELTLKLSGEYKCPKLGSVDFEIEGYRNYLIITDFLLGEHKELVRRKWGLSKEDFKELIFELYCTLVRNHTRCGLLKKGILYLLGIWKFYVGKRCVW